MRNRENQTPAGSPLLDCENDHECTVLACDFCLKELPDSGPIAEEGQDYIAHFCGLDCLEAWRRTGKKRPMGKPTQ